jgi:shikimate dehydrogenase
MRNFGLVGYPLSHSFSKQYFTEKFEREGITGCRYDNYSLQHIGLLPKLISDDRSLAGLNVTIPYKEQVRPFLDEMDDEAARIGAVNTIKISRNGDKLWLKGFNTDAYGFRQSVMPYLDRQCTGALILGTGGSSKAVAYVLREMGMEVIFVSRNPHGKDHIPYNKLDEQLIARSCLLVNTSPVGMYPDTNHCPEIPYWLITPRHILFDLIYNPAETLFLSKGRDRGARTINGLQMLHLQAEKSWSIWNEK